MTDDRFKQEEMKQAKWKITDDKVRKSAREHVREDDIGFLKKYIQTWVTRSKNR